MKKSRYGKEIKSYIICQGKEPVELKGAVIYNSEKYFLFLVGEDEYGQLEKKKVKIFKSMITMEILDDGDYRVIIPMWLHDKLCKDIRRK